MTFTDQVSLKLAAGDGGNGFIHFRREKFVPRGGPDGGDGGNGGSVIIKGTTHRQTLSHLTGKKHLAADHGQVGGVRLRAGANGQDIMVEVPVGTEITDTDSQIVLADITDPSQVVVIAKGGSGGWGNWHFKSSTNQAPRRANPGTPGESRQVTITLKLIADVGLVGQPNAGKSTLINVVTDARSKTAAYPFTTLQPHLGLWRLPGREVVVADIPGLIEGASRGKGLGHEFLRHIERTKIIVHLVSAEDENVCASYQLIENELKSYSAALRRKPRLIVLNKIDLLPAEAVAVKIKELRQCAAKRVTVVALSALTRLNIDAFVKSVQQLLTDEAA